MQPKDFADRLLENPDAPVPPPNNYATEGADVSAQVLQGVIETLKAGTEGGEWLVHSKDGREFSLAIEEDGTIACFEVGDENVGDATHRFRVLVQPV